MTTTYTTFEAEPLGELLLVANETCLLGVYYADCQHAPPIQGDWRRDPRHPVLTETERQLREFLGGERTAFSVSTHAEGTSFQRKVWAALALIPYGETISYSELARRVGAPAAVRAVGSANGRNPLSIIVPCHRVIAKGGTLGGYAGQLSRKQQLLELERSRAALRLAASG